MGKFHVSIFRFLDSRRNAFPKNTFAVSTSGSGNGRGVQKFSAYLQNAGFTVFGAFECKGFYTFGIFKLFGGLAKGHPDFCDIAAATAFFEKLQR